MKFKTTKLKVSATLLRTKISITPLQWRMKTLYYSDSKEKKNSTSTKEEKEAAEVAPAEAEAAEEEETSKEAEAEENSKENAKKVVTKETDNTKHWR